MRNDTVQKAPAHERIQLRAVTPDDEEFLSRLYQDVRSEEVAAWGWDPIQQEAFLRMQFNVQRRAYGMQYAEADHNLILFDGQLAGRLLVNRSAGEILLVDIAVLGEYRNLGIGTALIKELCDEAARADGAVVRLQVLKSNAAAARLYQRLGFQMTGETGTHLQMEWVPGNP